MMHEQTVLSKATKCDMSALVSAFGSGSDCIAYFTARKEWSRIFLGHGK